MKKRAFPVDKNGTPFDPVKVIAIANRLPKKISLNEDQVNFVNSVVIEIAAAAKIPYQEFMTRSRFRALVQLRHLLAYFLTTRTTYSFGTIGRFICGVDHTIVIHSLRAHESLLVSGLDDDFYLKLLLALRRKFASVPMVVRVGDQVAPLIELENKLCIPIEATQPLSEKQLKRDELCGHLIRFCEINKITGQGEAIQKYTNRM